LTLKEVQWCAEYARIMKTKSVLSPIYLRQIGRDEAARK